jgi:N-acetylglutamate synthase-like GNAT family acetyltransferase
METPLTIRAATEDDASAIALLSEQLGYRISVGEIATRLAALPVNSEAVLVAERGRAVVGWMQIGIGLAIESSPHTVIRGLVVLESCRGQGIGHQLVSAAETWTRQRELTELRVRSNATRAATHHFYRQLGFGETKQQVVFVRQLSEKS